MASARYWRLVGLSTVGDGDLELSALHLYDGAARVGAAVTPTCSHAPAAGALASLSDADLGTTCRFAAAAVRSGGFWLEWDFGGAPAQVTLVLPGSAASQSTFLSGAMLQSRAASTDVWSNPVALGMYPWPGASSMVEQTPGVDASALRLHGNGTDGSTTITDSSPVARAPSAVGNATISADQSSAYGGTSIKIAGSSPLTYAHSADLAPTDFAVRLRLWTPSQSGLIRSILLKATSSNARTYGILIDASGYIQAHRCDVNGSFTTLTSSRKILAADWTYIEFSRAGGILRLFMDGDLVASTTVSGGNYFNASDALCIGATSNGLYALNSGGAAYIQELSIGDGDGATSSYAPPVGPDSGNAFAVPWRPFSTATRAARQAIAASAPVPAFCTRRDASALARDMEFGGAGTVTGQTLVKDGGPEVPTRARVRLLRARDGLLARETWSDPATGAYSFAGLDVNQEFIGLAQHPGGTFEPVSGGPLVPKVP